MKKSSFFKFLMCFTLVFSVFGLNVAQARTDNARVLGGISRDIDIFNYLNTYSYHIWKSNHKYSSNDLYISKDKCVAVNLWNDLLGQVFLMAPGYTTDKGIAVGMTVNDIAYAYGPIYDYDNEPRDYKKTYGTYKKNHNYKNYRGYGAIEYVSDQNEGLNFVIDKKTNKIVLIMYQANRHGDGDVLAYVDSLKLLPEKK